MRCISRFVALASALLIVDSSGDDSDFSVEDLAQALVEFYAAVGQPEKATDKEHAKELLEMPKWKGKEMNMFKNIQKKYADEDVDAVKNLEEAFNSFSENEARRLQTKLTQMKLQKEVLEGINKITTVVNTLQTIGFTDDDVFVDVKQSAEEGNRLLESINNEETWEEKLKLVRQGLSKRSEWIEQLKVVSDALSAAQEEATNEKSVETTGSGASMDASSDAPETHELDDPEAMQRAAKIMKKAVLDGNVEVVAKLMSALQEKPEMLAKLVMWADDRTGANLLHWCGFYGKDAHVALARTFMMVPGVNASVSDKHQHTPCYIACKQNHPDVLEQLIAQPPASSSIPCDPFALGSGSNCLHLAAQGGFTKILQLLAPRLTTEILEMDTGTGANAISLAEDAGSAEAAEILGHAAARIRSIEKASSQDAAEQDVDYEQAVARLTKQITNMAVALKASAGEANTPTLKLIGQLAEECQNALDKAAAEDDLKTKAEILVEALSKKGEWLKALGEAHKTATERHEEEDKEYERALFENKLQKGEL